jgi:hypothetical protein
MSDAYLRALRKRARRMERQAWVRYRDSWNFQLLMSMLGEVDKIWEEHERARYA